jgi:cysteine-rich repeat protein
MAFPLKSALSALVAGMALFACGQPDPVDLKQSGLRVCTPNDLIECVCPNTTNGLKRCNADGTGFEECRISDTRSCDDPVTMKDSGPPVNKCGNGTPDPGEACDDGNKADGDFCSSLCLPKGDPKGAGTCPGMPVHLWGSEVVEGSANTVSYEKSHTADKPCADVSIGLFGNDRVFAVTAHRAGTLHVETSAASYDVVLFVHTTCLDNKTEVACANAHIYDDLGGEQLDTPIKKDQTLYVIVDGGSSVSTGDTQIRFSIK